MAHTPPGTLGGRTPIRLATPNELWLMCRRNTHLVPYLMTQTDYILRMIEQLGQMLASLRNVILRQSAPAQVIVNRLAAAASEGGFDLTLARAASPETIEMLVAPAGDLDAARCWLVAEILYLDGLQAQLEDRPEEAAESLRKSLPLYTLLKPKALFLGLPEAAARISEVEDRLSTLEQQPSDAMPSRGNSLDNEAGQ